MRVRLLVRCRSGVTATEQVAVIVAAELFTEQVEGERIDARVDEGQTEADDLEDVPEHVEGAAVEMVPDDIHVAGQPTGDEDDDKGQHDLGDALSRLQLLTRLTRADVLGR